MGYMNKTEYAQACLFRVREGLQTASAWWEHDPKLTHEKIEQTVDMLEDVIDELQYFHEKMENPLRDEEEHSGSVESKKDQGDPPLEGGGYDPRFTDSLDSICYGNDNEHYGLYKE